MRPSLPVVSILLIATAGLLSGCDQASPPNASTPAAQAAAEASFDTIAQACAQALADRKPVVQATAAGGWTQTGYSPAQVQKEVTATESTVTPYVGKIVVKDNTAQATADTEAAARAITLTPAHLLAHRTHTFIYRFDGQHWHWANGLLLTKVPSQNDESRPLALADVAAPDSGLAGCLPSVPRAAQELSN